MSFKESLKIPKRIIISCKLKKGRQYNGQKKKDIKNKQWSTKTTHKTKQHEYHLKTGELCCSGMLKTGELCCSGRHFLFH